MRGNEDGFGESINESHTAVLETKEVSQPFAWISDNKGSNPGNLNVVLSDCVNSSYGVPQARKCKGGEKVNKEGLVIIVTEPTLHGPIS